MCTTGNDRIRSVSFSISTLYSTEVCVCATVTFNSQFFWLPHRVNTSSLIVLRPSATPTSLARNSDVAWQQGRLVIDSLLSVLDNSMVQEGESVPMRGFTIEQQWAVIIILATVNSHPLAYITQPLFFYIKVLEHIERGKSLHGPHFRWVAYSLLPLFIGKAISCGIDDGMRGFLIFPILLCAPLRCENINEFNSI